MSGSIEAIEGTLVTFSSADYKQNLCLRKEIKVQPVQVIGQELS